MQAHPHSEHDTIIFYIRISTRNSQARRTTHAVYPLLFLHNYVYGPGRRSTIGVWESPPILDILQAKSVNSTSGSIISGVVGILFFWIKPLALVHISF